MQRTSAFVILKKDLGKTAIRKRNGQIIEFWISKGRETGLLLPNGQKYVDETSLYLDSIIICHENDYILKDTKDKLLVAGVKVTEEDLQKYLKYRKKIK